MILVLNLLTISNLIWGDITTTPQGFKKVYKEYGNWSLLVPGCFETQISSPGIFEFKTDKCPNIEFKWLETTSSRLQLGKYKSFNDSIIAYWSKLPAFKKIDDVENTSYVFLQTRQDSKHYSKKGLQYVSWEVRIECNGHEVEISVPFEAKASDATFERDNFKTTLTLFPEIEEIVKSFKCHKKAEPKK